MAETWKFNGTKLNVPQKVTGGEEDYIISGKSYLDDTYVEDFTRLYYDDTAKYLVFGAAGSWNGSNNTYASANILVLDTAPTGALLTFLQTYATKQLTLKQSVEQHITDAYTAIGNKSGTIPTQKNLANLAGAINTISTGVDTSDGDIEPTTVLKGYKGYAKGVAVDGAIETYDGTVEDVQDVVTELTITVKTVARTTGTWTLTAHNVTTPFTVSGTLGQDKTFTIPKSIFKYPTGYAGQSITKNAILNTNNDTSFSTSLNQTWFEASPSYSQLGTGMNSEESGAVIRASGGFPFKILINDIEALYTSSGGINYIEHGAVGVVTLDFGQVD